MPGRLRAMWLALALCASAPLLAAPLVLKDDYRSPRNKERPLRKATTLIVLHTTEAHAKSSLNKLSERGEAHYCVVEDGTVYRIIDRDREAFHAGARCGRAKRTATSSPSESRSWATTTRPSRSSSLRR